MLLASAIEVHLVGWRRGYATFGDALTLVLRHWPVRLVAVGAWLWLGWHLFVRVHGADGRRPVGHHFDEPDAVVESTRAESGSSPEPDSVLST